jgi:hypothetical protein
MKSKNKLVWLQYYETPTVAIDFATEQPRVQLSSNIIDHNIMILVINDDIKSPPYRGQIFHDETLARITFRNKKWYYSIEPRIECDQFPLISMANLARKHAIKYEDNVREFYWLRAVYKTEAVYR